MAGARVRKYCSTSSAFLYWLVPESVFADRPASSLKLLSVFFRDSIPLPYFSYWRVPFVVLPWPSISLDGVCRPLFGTDYAKLR